MEAQLMAMVAEGQRGRIVPRALRPMSKKRWPRALTPSSVPETELPERPSGFRVQVYGMTRHRDLFTSRQLVALTTFSDLGR